MTHFTSTSIQGGPRQQTQGLAWPQPCPSYEFLSTRRAFTCPPPATTWAGIPGSPPLLAPGALSSTPSPGSISDVYGLSDFSWHSPSHWLQLSVAIPTPWACKHLLSLQLQRQGLAQDTGDTTHRWDERVEGQDHKETLPLTSGWPAERRNFKSPVSYHWTDDSTFERAEGQRTAQPHCRGQDPHTHSWAQAGPSYERMLFIFFSPSGQNWGNWGKGKPWEPSPDRWDTAVPGDTATLLSSWPKLVTTWRLSTLAMNRWWQDNSTANNISAQTSQLCKQMSKNRWPP